MVMFVVMLIEKTRLVDIQGKSHILFIWKLWMEKLRVMGL